MMDFKAEARKLVDAIDRSFPINSHMREAFVEAGLDA